MVSFQRFCVVAVTHTVYIGIAVLIIVELVRRARERHGARSIAVLSLVLVAWVAGGVCIPWSLLDPRRDAMPGWCGGGGDGDSGAAPPHSTVEELDQVQVRSREQQVRGRAGQAGENPAQKQSGGGRGAGSEAAVATVPPHVPSSVPLDPRALPAV